MLQGCNIASLDFVSPWDQTPGLLYCRSILYQLSCKGSPIIYCSQLSQAISWLQSPSAVILEPKKIKSVMVSIVSTTICHEVMGLYAMILVFSMLTFKPVFHFPLSLSSRGFSSSLISAIRVMSSAYLRLLIFFLEISIQLVLHPAQHFA